ncbi:MAG: glycosyltransferase, partial [Nitrospinales bacterium]
MKNSYPKTLVALIHADREDCLFRTLESIHALEYPRFSVLVADCGSSDGLQETLKNRFPGLTCLRKKSNTGIASARNFCMDYYLPLDFEFIFLLDNDIELDKFCLLRLADAMQADPSMGMAAPLILNEDGSALSSGGIYFRALGQPALMKNSDRATADIDFATGAIGLYRKKALQAAGPFDADFDPYGFEDIDYGLRLKKQGFL